MANSYRQTFNPLTGNFDLVLNGTAVLEPNLVYDQVVYVDKSNLRTYTEDGSYDKPFKSLVSMYTNVTDASAGKKYACMIAPGSYVEANTLELKPNINLVSFANDTVTIAKLNGTSVKWSNNNPGRLFIQNITFTNGVEVLNDNPTGLSGMVLDLDNCELASLIFNGRGGGIDFIQLRNDSRVSGVTTIKSASTTIFDSTLIGLLTMNDVGCLNPDPYGSAITASIRSNYQLNVTIVNTAYDIYVDTWGNSNIGTLTITSNSPVASTFNCDVLTYPTTISLSGSPLPTVVRTSKAQGVEYTPSTPANWTTVPDDVKEALDELAGKNLPSEQTYNILNNQTNTSLGLSFNSTVKQYFLLNYAVIRSVTGTELVESGTLRAIYKSSASTWFISNDYTGPGAGITFSMDSSGNVLYSTTNLAGLSYTGIMKAFVDVQFAGGSGEVNTASNLGAGSGTFASKVGADLQFKSLVAGTNVSLSSTATEITIAATDTGEVNTASNLGAGSGTFATKVGSDLQFKSLVAGSNVSLSSTANEITIAATGEVNTASNVGASGTGVFYIKSGTDLQFKKLIAGTNLTITDNGTTITINAAGGGMQISSAQRYANGTVFSYTVPAGMYAIVDFNLPATTTPRVPYYVTAGSVIRYVTGTGYQIDNTTITNLATYIYITVIQ